MLQATLNQVMRDEGIARYRATVAQAQQRKAESATPYGQRLLSYSVVPVANALRDWLKTNEEKAAYHRGQAFDLLLPLPPETTAFLALRAALDCMGLQKPYARAAMFIGSRIEDERRFRWFQQFHPGLFRKLEKQLARCGSYDHQRTVIVYAMNKHGLSEKVDPKDAFVPWDKPATCKVGALLLDLIETNTGLVATPVIKIGRKTIRQLQATEKTMEWIRGFNEYAELLDPMWLPTVEPPVPWTTATAGAYENSVLPTLPLVKRAPAAYVNGALAEANMPEVYATINALQNTPWAINQRVYGVLRHYWNIGRSVGALPPADDEPLPAKPADIATNKVALRAWKDKAARVHSNNAALRSVRLQARKLMNLAQRFTNTPKFYFPYQLDFRGRIYAIPTFLTPQGTDLARSLLLFADAAVINDDTDAYWLAVYGANLFGKDKITFEERVAWVTAQRESVLSVAADPVANTWWQEADEPWQFLGWCFEWAGWLTKGPGFETHLPVCLDGTNNGLQILSMLTRDELAGKATNVLPGEKPEDIYGNVAVRVVEMMKKERSKKKRPHAQYWLAFGINRKTTKRPVMVLPYGGTFHSCREYVVQWYKEASKAKGEELPDRKVMFGRCHYLADMIWKGIEFCVGRPRKAMAWLQQCAGIMYENDLPIRWITPSGFPVLQAYKDMRKYRVRTTLGDGVKMAQVDLQEENPTKLSLKRQKNGISPNFVHSLDAAALTKTVAICLQYKIGSYCMIHDSYGTHAPKVHEMAAALRLAFMAIFESDQLENLRAQLQAQLKEAGSEDELPPVPDCGKLDIHQLGDSEFFFA